MPPFLYRVSKETQEGKGEESNNTGGFHGGLLFGFANISKKERQRKLNCTVASNIAINSIVYHLDLGKD
jgi:hypothetical protein